VRVLAALKRDNYGYTLLSCESYRTIWRKGGGAVMAWTTAFTELLSVRYPIVSAPMGGSAGGALAAAVSNAGGFGMLGGGNGHPKWLEPELDVLAGGTSEPWGVGLLSWAVDPGAV
jgi:nitronate monooxygenase